MGVLAVIAGIYLVIFIASIVIITYKKGTLLKNKAIFIGVQLISLLFTYMAFTSLPSNYIFQKIICIILGLISISAYYFRDKKLSFSQILLSIGIIGVSIVMWL